MSLVVFDQVSLSLGGKPIVEGLNLRLSANDRVGLIGPNGSGKTTLLRMITGAQVPDGGQIIRRRELRVGHLPQEVVAPKGEALLTFVLTSVPGRAALERELSAAEADLEEAQANGADPDELTELAGRIADLHEALAHFEQHYSRHKAERILAGLGFRDKDHGRALSELSGGWRMRALLGALLFQRPDLLLLDEPTNHLDMPSVAWLSDFLERYGQAFVLISHDREFLNEQIRTVVSFEPEGVRTYRGNYDSYLKQREEEREVREARAKNLERERAHLERFVQRFRAKASKASQVQSRVKALAKLETVPLLEEGATWNFQFSPSARAGREVLSGTSLKKAYGTHTVFENVDVRVERGDRIAIIGMNGAGKTTLLRVLAGELTPEAGEVKVGHNVKLSYFAQHHAEVLPEKATVEAAVAELCPDGNRTRIRGVLGALMMGEDQIEKRIGVLSGGERARVALARMAIDPGNLLLMDEPTNHLDLRSSERLTEALATYDGTLLFVSHNRAFVRRLANKIWNVENGKVEEYPGTLDDYLHSMSAREEAESRATGSPSGEGTGPPKRGRNEAKERKRREALRRQDRHRRVAPLERRVKELTDRVAALEAAQAERTESLSNPTLYDDPDRRDRVLRAHQEGATELERLMEEWTEAEVALEKARAEVG